MAILNDGISHAHQSGNGFLKVLVDPPDANVDIIAVHGLEFPNPAPDVGVTWTSEGKLWLRDFLPRRVPRARICLFEYHSEPTFLSLAAGVTEQARNVLNCLGQTRANNPRRSLIFISHSLGGLIVERALVLAKVEKPYKQIQESTFGLIFFAAPQQVGNLDSACFGRVLARVARGITGDSMTPLVASLINGSPYLNTYADNFRQMLDGFQILSFYETRPLGRFGIIVHRDAASLGLPGSREIQIPIVADHRDICKFASDEDPEYKLVEDNITQMVSNATSPTSNQAEIGDEEYLVERKNTVFVTGQINTVTQTGYANRSITNGTENATVQVGRGNYSSIDGMGNSVIMHSYFIGDWREEVNRVLDWFWGWT
ncbi:hypothetical protein GGS24DRAFT_498665 [Hypoxylon argillaceum]|nr:hypothetical protein GGS24DRAFT_498665 [Hypoxylon argillaceum]